MKDVTVAWHHKPKKYIYNLREPSPQVGGTTNFYYCKLWADNLSFTCLEVQKGKKCQKVGNLQKTQKICKNPVRYKMANQKNYYLNIKED